MKPPSTRRPGGRMGKLARAGLVGLLAAGTAIAAAGSAAAEPAVSGETVPAPTSPMVGGYLLQGTPNFSSIRMELVTHFYWAFSTINNGKCTTASQAGIDAVKAQRLKQPSLKVLRSLGGWGGRGFSDAAATDAGRKTLVTSCIDAFIANGVADGIDLDWEFPVSGGLNNIGYRAEDRENMNLLVDEFRTQLNAYADSKGKSRRDFLVTAALPAGRWQDSGDNVTGAPYDVLKSFDLATLGRTLDTINIMTYDMGTGYSPISMFNQPLYKHPLDTTGDPYNSIDAAVKLYQAQGVPANKLTLGAEFTLSRGFQTVDDLNNGLFRKWTATGCGTATMANALRPGTTALVNWDPYVLSPYVWDPAARRFCSQENAQSLGIRAQYAKDNGLNGMFTWELTGDAQGSQLRAIALPFTPEKVVAAPAPTVKGASIMAGQGTAFSGEVARVTGSSAASLTAEINWGDNTHSAAVVVPLGNGTYSVTGTHTYAKAGSYTLTVATIDPDPINSRMVNAVANVGSVDPGQQTIITEVTGGALSLSVSDNTPIDLGKVQLNGQDQIVSGALKAITVVDPRGNNAGWSLTGQVSDFRGTGTATIPAANLAWAPTAAVVPGSLNLEHSTTTTPKVVAGPALIPGKGLSTAHTLCSSNLGASTGKFTCGGGLNLGVPFDTPVGAYTAVLTVTLI
ncbi:glycosyl hydrolase family 18 protein [Dactylosporangium sp. NPDC051484]|uniref:glycosyl hydrolase family 18 protein n=1 Tax=Dactylosporangium sp. NPDC051484 TaxID=3154942 RepID=UPI00344CF22A